MIDQITIPYAISDTIFSIPHKPININWVYTFLFTMVWNGLIQIPKLGNSLQWYGKCIATSINYKKTIFYHTGSLTLLFTAFSINVNIEIVNSVNWKHLLYFYPYGKIHASKQQFHSVILSYTANILFTETACVYFCYLQHNRLKFSWHLPFFLLHMELFTYKKNKNKEYVSMTRALTFRLTLNRVNIFMYIFLNKSFVIAT